jgi:hypothetical protein
MERHQVERPMGRVGAPAGLGQESPQLVVVRDQPGHRAGEPVGDHRVDGRLEEA